MRLATILTGIVSTALLALVAAMPWSADGAGRLVLQMLPVLAIIFWSFERPIPMAATTVFLLGLFIDIVVQAPVGFWTVIALAAAMFVRAASRGRTGAPEPGRALIAMFAIAFVAASAFGLAYLHTLRPEPVETYVLAALWAGVAYVPLAALFAIFARLASGPGTLRPVLDRGA